MSEPRTLEATAYKEGKWWMVSIPEIDALSQARTIEQVSARAVDLASIVLEVPKEALAVTVTFAMPEGAAAANDSWHQAQQELAAAKANVDATLAALAQNLKSSGYTLRDIGGVTGYTFQRIGQVLKHESN